MGDVDFLREGELVQVLGTAGISETHVSRLCQVLENDVMRFRTGPPGWRFCAAW